MYNITFQQIEAFLAIARYLNLSKAGAALFTSQPSLSRTLKRFEEGVGMRLFMRSNQGMELTSEGESLYAVLEPMYKSMEKGIEYVQNGAVSPIRALRIVEPSSYDFTEDFNPTKSIVKEFESRYPGVMLYEHLCDFKELRHELEFGNADIVITEDFAIRDIHNITLRRLTKLNLYITISGKHPLAQSDELDYRKLASETIYTIRTMDNEQEDIETQLSTCRYIGFTPKKIEFLPNFPTLIHAVSIGKGFSISAKLKNLGLYDHIKYYPINLPIMPHVSVVWRTGRLSREARNLIDMLPYELYQDQEDIPNAVHVEIIQNLSKSKRRSSRIQRVE
jgi:DNA-binding transcriptional LysR family regulator